MLIPTRGAKLPLSQAFGVPEIRALQPCLTKVGVFNVCAAEISVLHSCPTQIRPLQPSITEVCGSQP